MKKHPVDDLFSRKLHDAEVTPREEVYQKLQQRLQSKQRHLGWWQQGPWLAAAGISLLLVAGWVMWRNNNPKDTLTAQVTPKTESITKQKPTQLAKAVEEKPTYKKEILNQPISAEQQQVVIVEQLKSHQKSPKLKSSLPTPITQQQQVVQVPKMPESNKQQTSVITQEEPKVLAQVQATTSATELKNTERTIVLQLPELHQTLVAANEKAISATPIESITQNLQSTNQRFEDNILNQPRKSTRMAKVWKQLKNAKNGEKVDWDEVGFNPNKLLAKATGKEF